MNTTVTIGSKYRFVYPDYGTPDMHPDYTAHSGQMVIVKRQLTNEECDPECQPMFQVKARDGWVGSAHASELHNKNKPVSDEESPTARRRPSHTVH